MDVPEVVARYLSAYNRKSVADMLACMTEDVVFENVSNSGGSMRTEGKATLARLAESSAQAFASRRQTVQRAVVAADCVALEISYEAVVAVDLPNGWKAGQAISLRGASFIELRAGLICAVVDLS
jgi:ketosteroid isomerase-like protein